MSATAKPTRDECIRAAAPHLAALVLARRAQARAQPKDNPGPAPSPGESASDQHESAA